MSKLILEPHAPQIGRRLISEPFYVKGSSPKAIQSRRASNLRSPPPAFSWLRITETMLAGLACPGTIPAPFCPTSRHRGRGTLRRGGRGFSRLHSSVRGLASGLLKRPCAVLAESVYDRSALYYPRFRSEESSRLYSCRGCHLDRPGSLDF